MRTVSGSRNRTILLLVGIVLILLGVLAGLFASGLAAAVPWASSWAPEPSANLGSLLGPLNQYLPALTLVAAVVAALFALWWLLKQVPTKDAVRSFRLQDDDDHGTMTLDPSVLARAVEEQLDAVPGVSRAHAELTGSARHPELILKLTLTQHIPVERALREVYGRIVRDLATALETPLEHVGVRLDVARESARDHKSSTRGTSARTEAAQTPAPM